MIKKTIVFSFVFCLFTILSIQAQPKDYYTYLTDKKFNNAEEFFGYTFVPSLMEVPEPGQTQAGDQQKIAAGSYKFGVTRGNLFVKGDGIDGVHNINQINTTDYGYQLVLMNARDPKQQGHLKIIMLKNYVDALVFKANTNDTEMVFLLPEIDKGLNESEKNYFTDKSDIEIEFEEDIWGKEVIPFYKTISPKRSYQRLRKSDNMKITFVETEQIIEKGKKNKDDLVLAITEPIATEPVIEDIAPEPVVEDVVVVEEEEEEDDGFPSYFKVKEKKTEPIKEALEEEVIADIPAGVPEEIEEDNGDLFAAPEKLEEVQEESKDNKKNKKDKTKEKKVKIVMEYDIIINDFVFNDDGTKEPTETTLKVKDWKMRQDDSASNPNEVYQMELETNKGSMYVYLSGSMKITKIEFGPVNYIMRGL
jgi:hypothetical protein